MVVALFLDLATVSPERNLTTSENSLGFFCSVCARFLGLRGRGGEERGERGGEKEGGVGRVGVRGRGELEGGREGRRGGWGAREWRRCQSLCLKIPLTSSSYPCLP